MSGIRADISTLFEYPVAPDTCTTLNSRCDYTIQRFWDNCDLSKPIPAESDSLLLVAMRDYLSIMENANINVALASVRNLMFKAQANQGNFQKLLSTAEFWLYNQPNDMNEDVFLTFAKTATEASWAKKDMKEYYKGIIDRISACRVNEPMIDIELIMPNGKKTKLSELLTGAENYILLFTLDDSDGSIARVRLSIDSSLESACSEGLLKVINISFGKLSKEWLNSGADYESKGWTVCSVSDATAKRVDLRLAPSIFILDGERRVLAKNWSVDYLKNRL